MLKPFMKYRDQMFGVRITGGGPLPIHVDDDSEALPLLTIEHKHRCPYCGSPNCLHEIVCTSGIVGGNEVRTFFLSKCRRSARYFYAEHHNYRVKNFDPTRCMRCGSHSLRVKKRYRINPGKMDQEILRGLGNGYLYLATTFKCAQCRFDAYVVWKVDENGNGTLNCQGAGVKDADLVVLILFGAEALEEVAENQKEQHREWCASYAVLWSRMRRTVVRAIFVENGE